ncbi:hypothetical protein [Gelria sp. Kuro-4]|uniref:hypothetical protein n=1 Tax=Gelria sp. Kuro-4 TaxID=2796927 RepID=UPI001C8166B6|nr:hypothetical protein [Gelria sp. Kuro-4]
MLGRLCLCCLFALLGCLLSAAYFREHLVNGFFHGFDLVLEKLNLGKEELELEGETVEAHSNAEAVARQILGFYGFAFTKAAPGGLRKQGHQFRKVSSSQFFWGGVAPEQFPGAAGDVDPQ